MKSNALAPGRHDAFAQSLLPSRSPVGVFASNRACRASGSAEALKQGLPAAVPCELRWRGCRRSPFKFTPVPNPSVKRRANGVALGPRAAVLHHPSRGPSATPLSPAYLER